MSLDENNNRMQSMLLATMDACARKNEWVLRHRFCDIRDFLAGLYDDDQKWIAERAAQMLSTVKGLPDSHQKRELLVVVTERLCGFGSSVDAYRLGGSDISENNNISDCMNTDMVI